jgi:hypothetical protein
MTSFPAGVDESTPVRVPPVGVEPRAGEHHAERLARREVLQVPGRARLEVIDAHRPEPDRLADHAEAVELVRVDAQRVPQFLRGLEQADRLVERPRPVLAVPVDRDARERLVHGGERLGDRPLDEPVLVAVDRVPDAGGGGDEPAHAVPLARADRPSIFSSASVVSPYPLLTSTVAVPSPSIHPSRPSSPLRGQQDLSGARTARTVDMIPPPAFSSSRYDAPRSFISHSSSRSPAQQACVWASTNAGISTRPPASITIASLSPVAGERAGVRGSDALPPPILEPPRSPVTDQHIRALEHPEIRPSPPRGGPHPPRASAPERSGSAAVGGRRIVHPDTVLGHAAPAP